MTRVVTILGILALAVGCAKDPSEGEKVATGAERGPCYGNGTCNDGLVCLSDLCVRPPPADCAEVAKKIGHLTLSNWAPKEERAAHAEATITECKQANLTKEEGDCLLRATSRAQLSRCPKPLGMGSCDRIVAHIQKIGASDKELAQFLERGTDQIIKECEREGMTAAVETCVLAATTFDELKRCDPKGRR